MKTILLLAPVVVVFLIVGTSLYVRLAPTDPQAWHIDPEDPALKSGTNMFLLRGDSDVQSRVYGLSPDALLARLADVALATPRTRAIAGSVKAGRMTFITRSKLYGYPDFTTVTTVPVGGSRGELVIYARSRFGVGDHGVNRARVMGWLRELRDLEVLE